MGKKKNKQKKTVIHSSVQRLRSWSAVAFYGIQKQYHQVSSLREGHLNDKMKTGVVDLYIAENEVNRFSNGEQTWWSHPIQSIVWDMLHEFFYKLYKMHIGMIQRLLPHISPVYQCFTQKQERQLNITNPQVNVVLGQLTSVPSSADWGQRGTLTKAVTQDNELYAQPATAWH